MGLLAPLLHSPIWLPHCGLDPSSHVSVRFITTTGDTCWGALTGGGGGQVVCGSGCSWALLPGDRLPVYTNPSESVRTFHADLERLENGRRGGSALERPCRCPPGPLPFAPHDSPQAPRHVGAALGHMGASIPAVPPFLPAHPSVKSEPPSLGLQCREHPTPGCSRPFGVGGRAYHCLVAGEPSLPPEGGVRLTGFF